MVSKTSARNQHQLRQNVTDNIDRIRDGRPLSSATPPVQPSLQPSHNDFSTSIGTSQRQARSGLLSGAVKEKGTHLYVENIEVHQDQTYSDVCSNLRAYAKDTVGIRTMAIKIIRNRYCDDVVGAKILVPETQEYIALDPQVWPENVVCRRWEDRGTRGRKFGQGDRRRGGFNGYGGYGNRNRNAEYQYDNYYDSDYRGK